MARALNLVPFCFALVAMVAACGDDTRTPGNACSPACSAGLTCCGGACVATQTRADHCGMCGNVCAAGSTCAAGVCSGAPTMDGSVPMTDSSVPSMCTPTCSADERCCGATCFDRAAPAGQLDARGHESFLHCNGCGLPCDMERASRCGAPAGGGSAQCLCGNLPQCPAGQACIQREGNFICADLRFDQNNCGEVGRVCAEGESCSEGVCGCGFGGPTCGAGQACCGGACIDTSADPMNCGGCGTVCGANAPNCNAGTCGCGTGPACTAPVAGVFGMGGMPGQSCCAGTCVANTDTSCGCAACDTAAGDSCQVGGGGLIPGMGEMTATVCCGDESVAILGCGGGFPLPFP